MVLGTLRFANEAPEDAEVRRRAYYLALADLPIYAVQQACVEALKGRVGKSDHWAPQPGELHTAASRAMAPLCEELGTINRILTARVERDELPEEDRAKMRERFQELVESLQDAAANDPLSPPNRPAERPTKADLKHAAEKRLETLDYAVRPVEASEALLKILGAQHAEADV